MLMTLVTEHGGTIEEDYRCEQYNSKFHTHPAESLALAPEVSKRPCYITFLERSEFLDAVSCIVVISL